MALYPGKHLWFYSAGLDLISFRSRHHSSKSKDSSRSKSRPKSSASSTKAHKRVPSSARPKNTNDTLLTYSNPSPQTSQQPSREEKSKTTPSAHPNLHSGQHATSEPLECSLVDSAPTQQPRHPWQAHESLESVTYYLNDPIHSTPGYSVAYTNSLIYIYGFPDQPSERSELEDEIVEEAKSRARRSLDEYDSRC